MVSLPPTEENIQKCAKLLQEGELVGFPTETVYGLGANALNECACKKIFDVKQRDARDPLIVHIQHPHESQKLQQLSPAAQLVFNTLTQQFWPGPLTIVAKATDQVPTVVTGGCGFVGVRSPSGSIARKLLEISGIPIAAPSANKFGHVSPTQPQHVLDDLADNYKLQFANKQLHVLDGGSTECGIESTVVKIHDIDSNTVKVTLLRRGVITQAELQQQLHQCVDVKVTFEVTHRLLPETQTTVTTTPTTTTHTQEKPHCGSSETNTTENEQLDSPGQLLKHYAPTVQTFLLASNDSRLPPSSSTPSHTCKYGIQPITNNQPKSIPLSNAVVIDFGKLLNHLKPHCLKYFSVSEDGDIPTANKNLFAILRQAEVVKNAEAIIVPVISVHEEGEDAGEERAVKKQKTAKLTQTPYATNDRLYRAASGTQARIV